MPRREAATRSRQSGVALIWTTIFLLLFITLVGLAIDTAYVLLVAHQLQNCADASALAGAAKVQTSISDGRTAAVNIAAANKAAGVSVQISSNSGNAPNGDVVVGRFDRNDQTFTPQETSVNAVKVTAPRTTGSLGGSIALFFGPAFGATTSNVARSAIAMVTGGTGAGVIALNPTASCSFDVRGTAGSLVVNDGVIIVNSSAPTAACHSGQPTITADELRVHGGTDGNFENQVNFDGDLITGADPVPDPLASLPAPSYNPAQNKGSITVNGNKTINVTPGYYSGGFTVRNGTLNVAPGIYILGGAGLDDNGGNLIANGVMFYIISPGKLDLRGNGIITITPPDTSLYSYPATPDVTPYSDAAVSIFQARGNNTGSRILGTNQFNAQGTIYFPSAQIEIGGTSNNLANGLIADTIYAHGNGNLIINYEDQFPPLPGDVFLVK